MLNYSVPEFEETDIQRGFKLSTQKVSFYKNMSSNFDYKAQCFPLKC